MLYNKKLKQGETKLYENRIKEGDKMNKKGLKRKIVAGLITLSVFVTSAELPISTQTAFAEDSELVSMDIDSLTDVSSSTESMSSLEIQINEAKKELAEAEENKKIAAENYELGSLGFIDWMSAKTDLAEWQKRDLESARKIITDAFNEDFAKWMIKDSGLPASRNNMVTCLRDIKDAISLPNLAWSFSILRNINNFRDTDENYVGVMKRNEAKTSFLFMAIAQTGADRAAVLGRHTVLHSDCENLTNFSSWPAHQWRAEIATFNKFKNELGLDVLTSEDDVEKIEYLAMSEGEEVGHYTNLFFATDQVMGVGHCSYNNTYCYNASKISVNAENADILYTVDEFEALFDEYYATVDPDVMQANIEAIQEKINRLMELYYQSCPGHTFETTAVNEACKHGAGTIFNCIKCGYTKTEYTTNALGHNFQNGICARCKMTGPKEIESVDWITGPSWNQTFNQSYKDGQDVVISINFSTASDSILDDEFTIDIANPEIVSYEPIKNFSGTMHMNTPGTTTVTIYPTENPSLAKTYTISVTESNEHDYIIQQAVETGSGKTTKICTECGKVQDVTLPTNIISVRWLKNGFGPGTYEPGTYKTGEYAELSVEYSPTNVDNHKFVIEVSDPSIATVSYATAFDGTINIVGQGNLTVTVYAKYDPSVKQEYTFQITDNQYVVEPSENIPTMKPTTTPTIKPTTTPTIKPTTAPTIKPVVTPTIKPVVTPTIKPIATPTIKPTTTPTIQPATNTPDNDIPRQQSITSAVITLSKLNYTYDCKEKTPDVISVKIGMTILKEGTDYTTNYSNNINIGTAKVTITGQGNYKGSIIKTFTINAKKGTTFTSGSYQYKIIGQTNVAFIGLKTHNIKTAIIPNTVKIGGKNFKVTSIANKAFYKEKICKVTIGSNIKKIGSRTFYGCNKLTTITIKSAKLTYIGKNAFKRIYKMVEIKVPSKMFSAYKKLLKNKGQGSKVKIKKNI